MNCWWNATTRLRGVSIPREHRGIWLYLLKTDDFFRCASWPTGARWRSDLLCRVCLPGERCYYCNNTSVSVEASCQSSAWCLASQLQGQVHSTYLSTMQINSLSIFSKMNNHSAADADAIMSYSSQYQMKMGLTQMDKSDDHAQSLNHKCDGRKDGQNYTQHMSSTAVASRGKIIKRCKTTILRTNPVV